MKTISIIYIIFSLLCFVMLILLIATNIAMEYTMKTQDTLFIGFTIMMFLFGYIGISLSVIHERLNSNLYYTMAKGRILLCNDVFLSRDKKKTLPLIPCSILNEKIREFMNSCNIDVKDTSCYINSNLYYTFIYPENSGCRIDVAL